MVILYNALKTIHNRVFVFCLKKEQNLFLFEKPKKTDLKKQKNMRIFF